ncbi:hypothetical protein C8R47DRAFT_1217584 [Mycena vitilis]|nr:hypothetical protein C8R47DRAFT_1217584 [Mycena vitilis]
MRSGNSLPLNDDIVDRIFTFCSDFETLHALTLVCKALHSVFSRHPNSITTAVARNLIGPAFPEALQLARTDEDDVNDNASPTTEVGLPVLSTADKISLHKNAIVVNKLERLFSRWYKNRTSDASVLTTEETWRFRRAMYRVMAYSARFSACAWDEDEVDESSWQPEELERIFAHRVQMLNTHSTAELRQIDTVTRFLKEVVDWVWQDDEMPLGHEHADQPYDICIAAGPALILATYEAHDMEPMDEECAMYDSWAEIPLFSGFISSPLAQIWASREVPASPDDATHLSSILETVLDFPDNCQRCEQSARRLWTSATWENLRFDAPDLLPGKLPFNRYETNALAVLLHGCGDPSNMIGDIFQDVELRAEFEQWTARDALCATCLEKLLQAHIYLWLRGRKIKDGWVPPEDCWYVNISAIAESATKYLWQVWL